MESTAVVPALAALAHETRLAVFRRLVAAGPEGMAAGEFRRADPKVTAQALFLGKAAFHHPRFVLEHWRQDRVPQLRKVLHLLSAGLTGNAS